jgi:hypothetical protein
MERRVFTIDQFINEDKRVDKELDSLVELAILESEKTEEYRSTYKSVLFENFGVASTDDLTFDGKIKYLNLIKEALNVSGEQLNESLEVNESLKEDYATYFKETLESMGAKSISELGDKRGEFFTKIKEGWEKGKGRKTVSEAAINEADIKDADGFRKFAEAKLKKMFADDYDEAKAKKTIDGLIADAEKDDNWGAAIGKLNKA